MPRQGGRSAVITNEAALIAIRKIRKEEECSYHLVSIDVYKDSHQGAGLKSDCYKDYFILCHANSHHHTGWVVCPYLMNGICSTSKGLLVFNPSKGGTRKYLTHMNEHRGTSISNRVFSRDLSTVCQGSIIKAAARAVVLDLRPFSFAETNEGIAQFAQAVFEAGQTVPPTIGIKRSSILPSKTAVTQAVVVESNELRKKLSNKLLSSTNPMSGAASCDGVTVKLQRKHYYDFTLYYMGITPASVLQPRPSFGIENVTILLFEGPSSATAENIRETLDFNLKKYYGIGIDAIQKSFTMVTDGAAVMAKMAGSSVSRAIAPLDEKWMRCIAHAFNNVMKDAMKASETHPYLKKLSDDFKSMKRIVQDSKQSHWNSWLPNGYHLIQEVDTRFGTHLQVAERFLKSADKVQSLLVAHKKESTLKLFTSIQQEGGMDGIPRSFPTIEAIVDTFSILDRAITRFEGTKNPTIHKILPNLLDVRHRFTVILNNGAIFRPNSPLPVYPSTFTKALSGVLLEELTKIEIHDLWIVACFLHPLMRELGFINPERTRLAYRQRGEKMARVLAGINGVNSNTTASTSPFSNTPVPTVGNKRDYFSMELFADPMRNVPNDADEVSLYCLMDVSTMPGDRKMQMKDDYFAVNFWYEKKHTFPKLYNAAMRVFSTPVSSCGSERVFSTLNKIISKDRTCISPSLLQDMIVMRSLLSLE